MTTLEKEFTDWLYYFERLYPSADSPTFDQWKKAREEFNITKEGEEIERLREENKQLKALLETYKDLKAFGKSHD